MSATALTTIKADLKSWEKSFRVEHGREPTKVDIKNDPAIAAKYKLYSKTRAESSTASASSSKANHGREVVHQEEPSTPRKVKRDVDTFKTPNKPSSAVAEKQPVTEFAYAPSPSRLRALAASRSFSGSPNNVKKRTSDAVEEYASLTAQGPSVSPRNLGKSMIAPHGTPIATPRRKALKWLSGEASPSPIKIKRASPPPTRSNGQLHLQSDAFMQNGSIEDKAGTSSKRTLDEDYEDSILGPSPAKTKPNGRDRKAHQKAYLDLLEEAGLEGPSNDVAATSTSTAKSSWLSAPVDSKTLDGRDQEQSKLNGYSRPKKRTSAAAALTPFDGLGESNAESVSAMDSDGAEVAPKPAEADTEPAVITKKRRAGKGKAVRQDSGDMAVDDDANDAVIQSAPTGDASIDSIADYETRDLDDLYAAEVPQNSARTKAMHDVPASPGNRSQSPEEVTVDANLLELLSLRSSPVKKRLNKLHAKRDQTFKALLQEPTYVLARKREQEAKGLEDLADEAEGEDAAYEEQSDDEQGAQSRRSRANDIEGSDDDWDSDPEGWKDLGDGEMDDLDASF